jgi:SAM-dependent methyltransferase
MVKNEQDIIEPFIRHNSRYIDYMVIVDNASVDDTRRIVIDCAREIGNVIVADSDEFGHIQAELMTHMIKDCQAAFFADFMLLLDADEFISSKDRPTLLSALREIPSGGVGLVPWKTFVLAPGEVDAAAKDPPRSIRWRRRVERPEVSKVALRLDGAYRKDLRAGDGNHAVSSISGKPLPAVEISDLSLLHFPVRSTSQIIAKGVVGWMTYLTKNPRAHEAKPGLQWKGVFDTVSTKGRAAFAEIEMSVRSLRYAQSRSTIDWGTDVVRDEPPSDYVRHYSTGAFADPLSLIVRSWERSLSQPDPVVEFTPPDNAAALTGGAATSFDSVWHWDHLFVDVAPFRYIAEKHRPADVLDIGCGIGTYLMLFKNLGARSVFGVDGIQADASALQSNEYAAHDLTQHLDLGRVFDIVICVEIAQRLDDRDAEVLLDNITRHAGRLIVFSAAEPGQPGNGANCQPISRWLERWANRGWIPDLMDSFGMRCLASLAWFRRNLVVLRRGQPTEGERAREVLASIGNRQFKWYGQKPGIRYYAFSEPPPQLPDGGYTS